MTQIVRAHYGKARIPLLKIERSGTPHRLYQAIVGVDAEGPRISEAYARQDNAGIVATDTMKNFVYVLARREPIQSNEDFARRLACEFLARYPTIERLTVEVEEVAWQPLDSSPISFRRRGGEVDSARVSGDRAGLTIESSVRGLTLLKTTDSAFSGYVIDAYTTLAETEDRVLATSLSGSWRVRDDELDYRALGGRVKDIAVEVFATLYSRSVQHLSYEIGQTVLARCPEVEEISLSLPNLHCFPIDLARFGLTNEDALYLPSDTPHGDLHVTVRR